jgi:hypothetical protein
LKANLVKILDKKEVSKDEKYLKLFQKHLNDCNINELTLFNRINYNGVRYTSHLIKTKRDDSCFSAENKLGLIEKFIIYNNAIYLICRNIIKVYEPFFIPDNSRIKSDIIYCNVSNDLYIEKIENICKRALLQVSSNECYVSLFSISHLFN